MTAEPDLSINDAVPAPTKIESGNLFLWNWRQMQVYAQACVAHATAPLQAEIEALRAEVEFLRRGIVPRDDDMIVPVKLLDEINASGAERKDRAERLAEALREAYRQVRELCDCYGHVYPEASFVRYEALLRAQEEGE